MSKHLFIGIGVLMLVLLGTAHFLNSATRPAAIEGPSAAPRTEALPAEIELADTPATRTQGLSDRESIADNYGLLFVFPVDGRHGFWMKDMKFPIDIIWIAEDGRIVHLEHAVAPSTYPSVFTPATPARYVLETRAGYARERGWQPGTLLDLSSYQ